MGELLVLATPQLRPLRWKSLALFFHVQDKTWNEVVETHQKLRTDQSDLKMQQEAVWELFTSECTYFLDHLLVLKMVMSGLIFVIDGKY